MFFYLMEMKPIQINCLLFLCAVSSFASAQQVKLYGLVAPALDYEASLGPVMNNDVYTNYGQTVMYGCGVGLEVYPFHNRITALGDLGVSFRFARNFREMHAEENGVNHTTYGETIHFHENLDYVQNSDVFAIGLRYREKISRFHLSLGLDYMQQRIPAVTQSYSSSFFVEPHNSYHLTVFTMYLPGAFSQGMVLVPGLSVDVFKGITIGLEFPIGYFKISSHHQYYEYLLNYRAQNGVPYQVSETTRQFQLNKDVSSFNKFYPVLSLGYAFSRKTYPCK